MSACNDMPPRAANRSKQEWFFCAECSQRFAGVPRNKPKFCSHTCSNQHIVKTGAMRGANNPAWQGGVSFDNMRYRNRQKEKDPEKELARNMVRSAIRKGDIIRKACERCGSLPSHAHHDDYSRPLEVRFLCRPCHVAYHVSVGDWGRNAKQNSKRKEKCK